MGSPASKCLAPKLSPPGRPGRPTTLKSSKLLCETTANSCSSTPTTSVLCSLLKSEPASRKSYRCHGQERDDEEGHPKRARGSPRVRESHPSSRRERRFRVHQQRPERDP